MTAPPADRLDPDRIRTHLTAARLGAELDVRAEIGSTMDAAMERAAAGAPEGTVVAADFQTTGRGRMGRAWVAPPGTALLFSIVFRPPPEAVAPERLGEVPMAVALGVVDALERWLPGGDAVRLKWPNDVVVARSKIAGILSESRWTVERGGPRAVVVVGVGINVWQRPDELPAGAVSLAQRRGVIPSEVAFAGGPDRDQDPEPAELTRARLAADVLNGADGHYGTLLAGGRLVERWAARLETLGRAVEARGRDGSVVRGRAVAVAGDGALVVRTVEGGEVVVRAGDVTLAAV